MPVKIFFVINIMWLLYFLFQVPGKVIMGSTVDPLSTLPRANKVDPSVSHLFNESSLTLIILRGSFLTSNLFYQYKVQKILGQNATSAFNYSSYFPDLHMHVFTSCTFCLPTWVGRGMPTTVCAPFLTVLIVYTHSLSALLLYV